jgi:hypothetical protein
MGTSGEFGIDSISSLISSPDPLLRYQYARLYGPRTGPYDHRALAKLMLAVLEDGIACFQTYFFKPSPKNEKLYREAEDWMGSDSDDPFSFNDICESLGISPGWLRQELFRWRKGQKMKTAGNKKGFSTRKSKPLSKHCRGPKRMYD